MNNEKEELSTSMSRAYDNSLRPFHGFLIRPVFKVSRLVCTILARSWLKIVDPV
jgi:hypothetical protein